MSIPAELLSTEPAPLQKSASRIPGKILIALTGGIAVGLSIVCAPFVAPAFRKHCLPYVPATVEQVRNVISALPKGTSCHLDIGSGDGRIVIAAAKTGIESHGVELNSYLVQYSRYLAFRHGVGKKTKFFDRDLWKFNLKPYKCISIFGVEEMMQSFENKVREEVLPGTRIIACRFPLPSMQPKRIVEDGLNTVWVYDYNPDSK